VLLRKAALHRHWDAIAATAAYLFFVRSALAAYLFFVRSALANARVSIIEGPFRGGDGAAFTSPARRSSSSSGESGLTGSRGGDSRDDDKENDHEKVQQPCGSAPGMSAARAQAIHECTAKAGKYVEHTWGDNEIYIYRACMADHGQPE
jgi:hypothetical protein